MEDQARMRNPSDAEAITDPRERATIAHQLIDQHQEAIAELSRVRRDAIEQLLAGGMTQTQIAELLHMSRSRISQLLSSGTRPERSFLTSSSTISVAIGAKKEAARTDPGEMVSVESFGAYELMADLVRSLGLDANYEVVPPPGLVRLNRPGLIVLAGPRVLPFLDQVMEADPHLRFATDDEGWHLVDVTAGKQYRPPASRSDGVDYGYIGRLPRPDGKGTFLWLAGTHSQGTLGAATYLVANLSDLYKEVKTKRFSLIIECHFDPEDRQKILGVERVTPLYRHDGP
jgi:hypothetical protein